MFQIALKGGGRAYTVYAIDAAHDAFLIYDQPRARFRWVPIEEYMIAEEKENAVPAASGTAGSNADR